MDSYLGIVLFCAHHIMGYFARTLLWQFSQAIPKSQNALPFNVTFSTSYQLGRLNLSNIVWLLSPTSFPRLVCLVAKVRSSRICTSHTLWISQYFQIHSFGHHKHLFILRTFSKIYNILISAKIPPDAVWMSVTDAEASNGWDCEQSTS